MLTPCSIELLERATPQSASSVRADAQHATPHKATPTEEHGLLADLEGTRGLDRLGTTAAVGADQVMALQRLVGNASVVAMLNQRRAPDSATESHRGPLARLVGGPQRLLRHVLPPTVQRVEVDVAGGTFKDDVGDGYIPYNVKDQGEKYWEHGAQMSQLEFRPAVAVTNAKGDRATEVSLIQTTNSTVKEKGQVGEVEDQPESLLNERRTEGGSSIDQQIYLPGNKTDKLELNVEKLVPTLTAIAGHANQPSANDLLTKLIDTINGGTYALIDSNRAGILLAKIGIIRKEENKGTASPEVLAGLSEAENIVKQSRKTMNLDPRYAEQRTDTSVPMKDSKVLGTKAKETTGWNAKRALGTDPWPGAAVLRDRPAHKVAAGTELEGQEEFEVAAMADGDKFVGSVKWGWKIDGTQSELLYPTIVEGDHGAASKEFMEAAAAWNAMEVTDLRDETVKHTPIQLPTTASATMKVLARKLDAEADAILARIDGGPEVLEQAEITATQLREHGAARLELAAMVSDLKARERLNDYATKIQQAGMRYRTGARLPDRAKGATFSVEAWRMLVDNRTLFDVELSKVSDR